jgi:outer membrane protein OmpA-like peptidoglycan-associated protein
MLGWIAVLGERERIEVDLTTRTRAVLDRSGLGWANVSFEGRDAVLSGRARDESELPRAVDTALETLGVRVVDNRAGVIDQPDRYEWSAIRRDDGIRVDGFVPDDKTRRDVIGIVKANFPTLDVDDRMKLAAGSPPIDVWLGGVGFGLKQLSLLREGRVDLEHTSLSVSGDALDPRSYRVLMASLKAPLPQGIRLKKEAVRAPSVSPYAWSARRRGSEFQLTGFVPDERVRNELIQTARRHAPDARIVDRMELASGAPDSFAEVAGSLMQQLGQLEEGKAEVRDRSATLAGMAATMANAEAARSAMGQGALAVFRTSGDIRHREPVLETISPYMTSMVAEGDAVVLGGYIPDEKARSAVVALARRALDGRPVRDELRIGAGQPPGWEHCLEVAAETLQRLGNGRATMTARKLVISGVSSDEALVRSLPAEVDTRAGGECDTEVRVTLDAAVVQARQIAAEQAREESRRQAEAEAERRRRQEIARLETERKAAEDERRREAEEAAKLKSEDTRRRAGELTRQRAEEERKRTEAAAAAARQRAEEEARRLEVERRRADELARKTLEDERRKAQLEVERRAEAEAAIERERAEQEKRRIAKLANERAEQQRLRDEDERTRRDADARARKQLVDLCQEALSSVVREGLIYFSRASFDLDPSSFPTLNRVAEAANRCPTVIVEIEGHTDSEGTPERNQRLSNRRANAVRTYLERAGVDPERLIAIGYGQDRNIASNDTDEGRARNRRIEFVVKTRD